MAGFYTAFLNSIVCKEKIDNNMSHKFQYAKTVLCVKMTKASNFPRLHERVSGQRLRLQKISKICIILRCEFGSLHIQV